MPVPRPRGRRRGGDRGTRAPGTDRPGPTAGGGLDGSRLHHFDHRAPAGEVPGDVQRGRCAEADPGTPLVELAVGMTVPPELVSQYGHEPGLDEYGGPGA